MTHYDGKGKILVRVDAGNDSNGNPRRGWVVYSAEGLPIDFVDCGYDGHAAVKLAGYALALELATEYRISAAEYHSLRKSYPQRTKR